MAPTPPPSLQRLRRLQTLCAAAECEALLFVLGLDGRNNWGSSAMLKWLLGECGAELAPMTLMPTEGTSLYWGPGEAHDALGEETFLIVTPSAVFVYHAREASPVLAPHLSGWAGGGVGLIVATPSPDEALDVDRSELRKVAEFKTAIRRLAHAGGRVGVALPRGMDGPEELERWPLVASYAVEDGGAGVAGLGADGFLTMRNSFVDVTAALVAALREVDSPVVARCLQGSLGALREHWSFTLRTLLQNPSSPHSRLALTEAACAEQLEFLREFSGPSGAQDQNANLAPGALLGARTELLGGGGVGLITTPGKGGETKASDGAVAPLHVVIEGCEPVGLAQTCRTFFLATGKADGAEAQPEPAQRDVVRLMGAYTELVRATHHAAAAIFGSTKVHADADALRGALEAALKTTLASAPKGALRVHLVLLDSFGEQLPGNAPLPARALAYVRTSVHGLEGTQGELLGAVAVGDTWAVACGGSGGGDGDDDAGGALLPTGRAGLLTGAGCAPYFFACAGSRGAEEAAFREASRDVHNTSTLREHLLLGSAKDTVPGDSVVLLDCSPDAAWSHATGQLKLYEQGFVLLDSGLPPLVVSFAKDVDAVRLAEVPSGSLVLLLRMATATGRGAEGGGTTEGKASEVADAGAADAGTRRPTHAIASIVPATSTVEHMGLLLLAGTRGQQAIMHMLPDWRRIGTNNGVSFQQDDTEMPLPPVVRQTAEEMTPSFRKRSSQELIARCGDEDAEWALRALAAHGPKVIEPPAVAGSTAVAAPMPVYVLLGLPGSGVLEISRNLVNFSPDGVELSVVVASDSGAGTPGLVACARGRAEALQAAGVGPATSHLVLVAVSTTSAMQLGMLLEAEPLLRVASLSACVSACRVFQCGAMHGMRRWVDGLWEQCANGWASSVLLVDTEKEPTDAEAFRAQLRQNHPAVNALRVARGHMSSETIDEVLGAAAFSKEVLESSRCAQLCAAWRTLPVPVRPKLHGGSREEGTTFDVRLEGELCRQRLTRCLAKLLPDTKLRFLGQAAGEPMWATRRPQRQLRGIRRLWQLAKLKVHQEREMEAGLLELERFLGKWSLGEGIRVDALSGNALFDGNSRLLLDANSGAACAWLPSAQTTSLDHNSEAHPGGVITVVLSGSVGDEAQEALTRLFAQAEHREAAPLAMKSRASLTNSETGKVLELHRNDPLPDGWFFDGTRYVNFSGGRAVRRPDEEEILMAWVAEENSRVELWNRDLY